MTEQDSLLLAFFSTTAKEEDWKRFQRMNYEYFPGGGGWDGTYDKTVEEAKMAYASRMLEAFHAMKNLLHRPSPAASEEELFLPIPEGFTHKKRSSGYFEY